jgi:hypothetical protein
MPKYTVKPVDAHGHPVIRAITSINDDAAEEEINQKVLAAAKRGGSKVANVLLINTLSEVVLAWEVKEGVAGPCDAGPFQPAEQPKDGIYKDLRNEEPQASTDGEPVEAAAVKSDDETKESEVSKKVKKGKAKRIKKAQDNGGLRAGSKLERVANLLKRKSGCTAAECLKAVGWNAISMPYMAKAAGLKLKKEKVAGKTTRYYAQ